MRIKILIISLIVFIINTILVMTNNYQLVDEVVYKGIIFFKFDLLTEIMRFISFLGNTKTITVFNIILVIYVFFSKKYKLLMITGTSIASGLLNSFIKSIIKRSRPEGLALITQGGFSYPSGHTMISILFYGTVIYLLANSKGKYRKIFIILFGLLVILIPLSRIYLGVHYFSDIVGGLSFGLFILTTALTIYKKYIKE